jgi:hypothetical protein
MHQKRTQLDDRRFMSPDGARASIDYGTTILIGGIISEPHLINRENKFIDMLLPNN